MFTCNGVIHRGGEGRGQYISDFSDNRGKGGLVDYRFSLASVEAVILKVIFLRRPNLTFKNFVQENLRNIPKLIPKRCKNMQMFCKPVKSA